jgi:pyruvate,water dikinase
MIASFTNVIGLPDVLARVKDCWASLYGERVLAYRAEQHLTEEPAIAVIIQKMIFSEVSGVMFTADPTTGALDRMIIESVFGQGEAIVSGRVEPDTYILDKPGPRLLSVRQSRQKFKIVRGPDGADIEPPLDESEADRRSLSQAEIIAIAELGLRAERHYGTPQDLEWARAAGATYLVQSRPITTLGAQAASEPHPAAPASAAPALLTLRLGGIRRARVRAGADPHLPQPAARVHRRRGPGRRDDKSGLGAGNASRGRVDHRRGRRDLSRGDRLPRASAALRSRHRQRHYEPAYRSHLLCFTVWEALTMANAT